MVSRLSGLQRIGVLPYTLSATSVTMLVLAPLTLLYAVLDVVWVLLLGKSFPIGESIPGYWRKVFEWNIDNLSYVWDGSGKFRWTAM